MLLALWGQDLVQRQATNTKRTKEVYERISEKFMQNGFDRTADQVRTRVFNMIAEYRRILKDPTPERMKKCIFFEALHKIYQAKHMDDVKSALDDYEPEYPYSPASNTISSEKGDESVSDGEATDGNETINNTTINTIGNNNITANNVSLNDTNNGDSNNNNNTNNEKESSTANSHHTAGGAANKKIKLESPKSGHHHQTTNQVTNNNNNNITNTNMQTASTSAVNSSSSSSSNPNSSSSTSDHIPNNNNNNSKQTKTQVPLVATTIGGGASIASTSNSSLSSSSSTTTSSQRHQSLLLPHATTSAATSTPISKLTTSGGNNTPSYININSTKLPIIRTNQLIGHPNGNESINLNGTATRLPTTAAITSHQLYQAPVNTFDVTSSALLIDRMFAHLSRESENMREWIALEKERLAMERARKQQETEREVRRERVLIDTLMRFQDQWLSFLSRLDTRIVENANEPPPELRIPPKEGTSADTSQSTQASNSTTATTTTTTTSSSNINSNPPSDASKQ